MKMQVSKDLLNVKIDVLTGISNDIPEIKFKVTNVTRPIDSSDVIVDVQHYGGTRTVWLHIAPTSDLPVTCQLLGSPYHPLPHLS